MRAAAVLLCLLAALCLANAGALAQEQYGVNLLGNGGFETGAIQPTDWLPSGASGAGRDTRVSYSGAASGRLTVSGREGEVLWRQRGLQLVAGGRYVLSGWVRADAPAVAVLGIDWDDSSFGQQRIYRGIPADGQWHRVELEFVASGQVRAAAVAGGILQGSIWWDELSLVRIDDRPQQLAAHWEALLQRHGPVYTGLVVDARGLGVQRGMSPRIVDEQGGLVYTGVEADPRLVISRGIVAYVRDPDEAIRHPRLAVSELYPYRLPLVVTAVGRVEDVFRTSVVISVADAAIIRRELAKYDFLGRNAVVFVID
ncbi:MAG: hypothetical protein BAA04_06115 [Firmicutes bacterium ZCTH02-B6]|nr:MAG: hypothetical protein BAA04_06115 [Firmicutes bacterium ZCTH02-B6]